MLTIQKKSNMRIYVGLFVCNVCILATPSNAQSACLSLAEVKTELQKCVLPPEPPRNDTNLLGITTPEGLQRMCSIYTSALQCLKKLVSGCDVSSAQYHVITQALETVESNMSQLCTDPELIRELSTHSQCLTSHYSSIAQCVTTIYISVQDLLQHWEDQQITDQLCGQLLQLETCVDNILRHSCGPRTSEFTIKLIRAQQPLSLMSYCGRTLEQSAVANSAAKDISGVAILNLLSVKVTKYNLISSLPELIYISTWFFNFNVL